MKIGRKLLMVGLCTFMTVTPCFAQNKIIALNGKQVTMDTQVYNNRNYVQLKALSDRLGYNLSYNALTKIATLTKGNKKLTLSVAKGEAKTLNGRVYAPIAKVANYFGDTIEIKGVASRKKEFLNKLNTIEANMYDVQYLYDTGIESQVKKGNSIAFERWDNALNEIYGVLKTELSSSQMAKLKQEQLKWITYRDNEAQKAYDDWGGGSYAPIMLMDTKIELTKERCYELVNQYMP